MLYQPNFSMPVLLNRTCIVTRGFSPPTSFVSLQSANIYVAPSGMFTGLAGRPFSDNSRMCMSTPSMRSPDDTRKY